MTSIIVETKNDKKKDLLFREDPEYAVCHFVRTSANKLKLFSNFPIYLCYLIRDFLSNCKQILLYNGITTGVYGAAEALTS